MYKAGRTYNLLGNHAAHAYADDVQLALALPANLINDFDYILGHLRSGVSVHRFIRIANAPVIDYQRGVSVTLRMREVFGLALLQNRSTISKCSMF